MGGKGHTMGGKGPAMDPVAAREIGESLIIDIDQSELLRKSIEFIGQMERNVKIDDVKVRALSMQFRQCYQKLSDTEKEIVDLKLKSSGLEIDMLQQAKGANATLKAEAVVKSIIGILEGTGVRMPIFVDQDFWSSGALETIVIYAPFAIGYLQDCLTELPPVNKSNQGLIDFHTEIIHSLIQELKIMQSFSEDITIRKDRRDEPHRTITSLIAIQQIYQHRYPVNIIGITNLSLLIDEFFRGNRLIEDLED